MSETTEKLPPISIVFRFNQAKLALGNSARINRAIRGLVARQFTSTLVPLKSSDIERDFRAWRVDELESERINTPDVQCLIIVNFNLGTLERLGRVEGARQQLRDEITAMLVPNRLKRLTLDFDVAAIDSGRETIEVEFPVKSKQ